MLSVYNRADSAPDATVAFGFLSRIMISFCAVVNDTGFMNYLILMH
ncbi:hypothetical protein OIU84_016074, partial [Salix udensis]